MKRKVQKRFGYGVILTVLALALVVTGCGNNTNANQKTNNGSNETTNQSTGSTSNTPTESKESLPSGTVTIAGSTSVQPLAEELGMFYMEEVNSDARIEVAGGGSGAGVKAAQAGTADIGMASRALKTDETGIEAVAIAIDGIAVIVNKDSAVADLTIEQVKGIFSGTITNWKDAGGSDANIVVVNREEGSGTRDAFAELVLGEDPFVANAIIQNSTGAVREAVSQDVNAIGYISFGGLNDSIKTLAINGVEANEDNIKAGSYPISRPFNFLVNSTNAASDVSQAFIDYVLSDEGQAVVSDHGYVTVK